jgi:hypothetical protein
VDGRGNSAPPDAIPVAGLDRLRRAARRTMLQRSALGLAAVALLVAAGLTARNLQLPAATLVAEGRSGVIALDLSRSINGSRQEEMAGTLQRFAVPGQRVGLVAFSDTAYELLPPGSPGSELQRLIDLLTPYRVKPTAKKLRLPAMPWDVSFRAGTVISSGLEMAQRALRRHGESRGTILLVSDLSALADDLPRVANQLVALRNAKIDLRIAAVEPTETDRAMFERLAGKDAFVSPSSLGRGGLRGLAEVALEQPVPGGLVVAALALLAVLALNELWCGRLVGPHAEPREAA